MWLVLQMCVRCQAVQVLLEAMRRCNDLGLDFSLRAVHFAMKVRTPILRHWICYDSLVEATFRRAACTATWNV